MKSNEPQRSRDKSTDLPLLPVRQRYVVLAGCILLVVLSTAVFGRTVYYDFVNYDDHTYVYDNPLVAGGVSLHTLAQSHARNWHPLTTLSHLVDWRLYWVRPAGHHFTNVALHSISAVLLFLVLRHMTDDTWSSAFVAGLFAIHPLHVESVAWVSERKDVLSGLMFMLTLAGYTHYARRPSVLRYLLVILAFALGLMSKPMLVTVPFVLLLCDYWPLGRMTDRKSAGRLLLEKVPLLLLSIGSSVATVLAAKGAGEMDPLPFWLRIENALVSYAIYIWQMFWPARLAVFYPYPDSIPIWAVLLSLMVLIGVTVWAVLARKRYPWLAVGWLWYLGMLVPVIGIWQIGLQGHADRYTYLPQLGLYLIVAWSLAATPAVRRHRIMAGGAALLVLGLLGCSAWHQVSFWQNSETLWNRALSVTNDNDVAHNNLGLYYAQHERLDDAISHYAEALKIHSGDAATHYKLSTALVHNNMGNALMGKGRVSEAILQYDKSLELRPDYPDGHYNLGRALFDEGRVDDAIRQWETSLTLRPDDAEAHTSLGNAYLQKDRLHEAAEQYEKAISVLPPSIYSLNNLAWILAISNDDSFRNGKRAIELAERAIQLSGGVNPVFLRTLAAAYAETNQFAQAVFTAHRAVWIAQGQGAAQLEAEINEDLALYQRNLPLRTRGVADHP